MSTINKMIPPIGTKGIYVLMPPYDNAIRATEVYECGAIRYFTDIENNGRNVFELYYKPFGLTENDHQTDLANSQVLVTLLSPKYPPVYVPSSYIKSYPSLDSKQYNQVVLSASLGALPDEVILEPTIQAMKNVIEDFIGVEVEINVGILPLTDAVSPTNHETRESARLGAINRKESDYSRLTVCEGNNMELRQRNAILEQIIKDYGLIN